MPIDLTNADSKVTLQGELKIDPKELEYLQSFLDRGDRGGYYMALYNMTGNTQCIEQAQISTFSEGAGGVAYVANYLLQTSLAQGEYPGIYFLSQAVAQFSLLAIQEQLDANRTNTNQNTGYLTAGEMFASADRAWAEAWIERDRLNGQNIQELFPGNLLDGTFGQALTLDLFINHFDLPPLPDEQSVFETIFSVVVELSLEGNLDNVTFINRLNTRGALVGVLGLGGGWLAGKQLDDYEDNAQRYRIDELPDGAYKVVTDLQTNKVVGVFDSTPYPASLFDLLNRLAAYLPAAIAAVSGGLPAGFGVAVVMDFFQDFLADFHRQLTEDTRPEGTREFDGDINPMIRNTYDGTTYYPLTDPGTAGNDTRWGTGGLISGLYADTLYGQGGADRMFGGDGGDELHGNQGDDILYGQDGSDILYGEEDNDLLRGGAGNDTLHGGSGNDLLDGGDITPNSSGNDELHGGAGNDTLVGADGNDVLNGDSGADELIGGSGTDTLNGGAGSDNLQGGVGADTYVIEGSVGNDTIIDEDGGVISYLNHVLSGGKQTSPGAQEWRDQHATYRLITDGAEQHLLISVGAGSVTIRDWTPGHFGIQLQGHQAPTPIQPQTNIAGDLAPVDHSLEADGVQTANDALGNVIVNPGQAEANRADSLFDSAANDELRGHGGDDTLDAFRGGHDLLDGGAGNDYLKAGGGDDTLIGGEGLDRLLGQAGDDKLYAESEQSDLQVVADHTAATEDANNLSGQGDLLAGGAANDWSVGSRRADVLLGGEGQDTLWGGAGDDFIRGDSDATSVQSNWQLTRWFSNGTYGHSLSNAGYLSADNPVGEADKLYGGAGNDWLFGEGGQDNAYGGSGDDVIFGGADSDWLEGNSGDDVMSGDNGSGSSDGHGHDRLDGGAGNDFMWGDAGHDVLLGGDGNDELHGDNVSVPVELQGDDFLDGGAGNDLLTGNGGNDSLFGGLGDDELNGDNGATSANDGDDFLYGEEGNDLLTGNGGDDRIFGGVGNDVMQGDNGAPSANDGDDYMDGGDGADHITGNGGDDIILGGVGNDVMQGDSGAPTALDGKDHLDGGQGSDTIVGGGNDDILLGGEGNDVMNGDNGDATAFDGDDNLDGGAGNDTMYGSGGRDTLIGGSGDDVMTGDAGNSTAGSFGDADLLDGGEGDDRLYGEEGEDTLFGGSGKDILNGNDGNDLLYGGAGDDRLFGEAGDDVLDGGDGNDYMLGEEGSDLVGGGSGNDTIEGGAGNDSLTGGLGRDTLAGGTGDDLLDGGSGDDSLDGGAGNDTYVFGRGYGRDEISESDVTVGNSDRLILNGLNVANVQFQRTAYGLEVQVLGTDDSLLVRNHFGVGQVEQIQFGDGSVWDSTQINAQLMSGTVAHDHLVGSIADDVLSGGLGVDTIEGGDGNDTLQGGAGDEYFFGEAGSDTYVYALGDGSDTFRNADLASGKVDTLQLLDLNASDITLVRSQQDLRLAINGTNNYLYFDDFFGYAGGAYLAERSIDRIVFADGSIWDRNQINAMAIVPTSGDDDIIGYEGNDALHGGAGNDSILGDDGNDSLDGGLGNDTLHGGVGDDVYQFGMGSGADSVYEQNDSAGGMDTVLLNAGLVPSDITLVRNVKTYSAPDDLIIQINATGEQLRVVDYFGYGPLPSQTVEFIEFSNGTVWDYATVAANAVLTTYLWVDGTAGNDALAGGSGDDTIIAGAGHDHLMGGAGDDRLWSEEGNDTLIGGFGQDYLEGGAGNDTYLFSAGSGADEISDGGLSGDVDVLSFTDVNAGAVTVRRQQDDLIVSVNGTSDSIKVSYHFASSSGNRLSSIVFADGSTWNRSAIEQAVLVTTSGADTLIGYGGSDLLLGAAGADTLEGRGGNDTLDGGTGDDLLEGGSGSDTYVFGLGYGSDYIFDTDAWNGVPNTVRFINLNAEDLSFSRGIDVSTDLYNLIVQVKGSRDRLEIRDVFWHGLDNPGLSPISRLEFADGSVWSMADVWALGLVPTSADDFLLGDSGDNTLNGGAGNDTLHGGVGNDTYQFGRGSGKDVILASDSSANKIDTVQLLDLLAANVSLKDALKNPTTSVLRPDDVSLGEISSALRSFASEFEPDLPHLGSFAGLLPVFRRTHACAPISLWRAIHKLDSANSVLICKVFFFRPR